MPFLELYTNKCKCHQLKIDFSFVPFLTSILAYDSQASTETTSVERQNVYINILLEFAVTDHPVIVNVAMPVIIKPNISTFSLQRSCYMSNDN